MMKIANLINKTRMQDILTKTLFLGMITSASFVFGSLKVNAQVSSLNNLEITNYAQAVLAMEPARQQAFGEIKKIIGNAEIPKIVCNDPKSMNGLPSQARDIAINYCNQSQKIVEDNGLTIQKFNTITMELQNNNNLKRQVYNTLIRLQQKPNSQ
ncbi:MULTISPECIES: DUF4168 domain-containing protein [unclassified Anabaena]|uniref:DUF4168 domain-containing protein n=1 Tax=unclassified Anabaena TaxID=2619674 RepID=UPI000832DEA3|nr:MULTISPECIES: DUF4168 domain-containing protein [unclassified Anabaena]